jgi:hypothetical protein
MRVWLDDNRDPKIHRPNEEWIWVTTAKEAIELLKTGNVIEVSLDHDLGDEKIVGNGNMVACWIEDAAYRKEIPKLTWSVHSQNSVGVGKMVKALSNANRFWDEADS